jgi:uncharacterized protein YdcH (DUF465 family)
VRNVFACVIDLNQRTVWSCIASFIQPCGPRGIEFIDRRMSGSRTSANPLPGGRIMFENQQRDDVEALMKTDAEFRRLYQHHKHLDSKVHDADIGVLPIDDATLVRMKKEKLRAKTQLERMWANRASLIH